MRPTFVTAYVLSGDSTDDHEPARRVTIRQRDDGTFVTTTVKGTSIGDPNEYQFMGRSAFERLQAALVNSDKRRSEAAVGMFTVERRHLVTTTGKLAGSWKSLAEFGERLLNKSADVYHGETYDDRLDTLVAITNQESWD